MGYIMANSKLKTIYVTFETNGTQIFAPEISPEYMQSFGIGKNCGITWSVSPKLSNSGESFSDAIRPEALASYNAWPYSYLYLKFVVRDSYDIIEVEQALKEYDNARIKNSKDCIKIWI